MARVRVRRERPTALAWAVALCVTMLVVYVLTLNAAGPEPDWRASAARVTREMALEDVKGWCVSLALCDSAEAARLKAAEYGGIGAAGYVAELKGGWRVLGAVYDTEREAKRIADRLRQEADLDAEVLCLSAEGARLRVTASEGQIDALAAADALLREQVRQLGQMAGQLDRGEMRADGARALCALSAGEAEASAKALADCPGAASNGLCASLIQRLERLARLEESISRNAGAEGATLSGLMRCAQVEGFLGVWESLRGIGGG